MATWVTFLVMTLWLSWDLALGEEGEVDMDTNLPAPPELASLIPEAAAATVAAGYFNISSELDLTNPTTSSGPTGKAKKTVPTTTTLGTTNRDVNVMKPGKIKLHAQTTEGINNAEYEDSNRQLEMLQKNLISMGSSLKEDVSDTSSPNVTETPSEPLTNGSEYVGVTTEVTTEVTTKVTTEATKKATTGATMAATTEATTGATMEATTEAMMKETAGMVQVVTVGVVRENNEIVGTPVEVATMEYPKESDQKIRVNEEILMVGDDRYDWQEWSSWHCNCPAGSMSRVRDIAYAVPDVHLDPLQYNVLRFERKACDYGDCGCDKQAHQCDRKEVTCYEKPAHMCALKDLEFDQNRSDKKWPVGIEPKQPTGIEPEQLTGIEPKQPTGIEPNQPIRSDQKQTTFWANVHSGLKNLYHSMKDVFPNGKKPEAKKKTADDGVR